MTSETALLVSSLSFWVLLCLLVLSLLWFLRKQETAAKEERAAERKLTEKFLQEIATTREMQQRSLDQVFTGLITGNPQEYAAMRQAKLQEAAQLQWLASVEYAESQKTQHEAAEEAARAEGVAIAEQYEAEQEELDAIAGSVYGGVA